MANVGKQPIQQTIIHLDKHFAKISRPCQDVHLVFEAEKADEQCFRSMEVVQLYEHWQDVMMTRVRRRAIFAVCSSMFVSVDGTRITFYIRARDDALKDFSFLYKQFLREGTNVAPLNIKIIDFDSDVENFYKTRVDLCGQCFKQVHLFFEREAFGF